MGRFLGRYYEYAPLAAGGMATVSLGKHLGPGGFSRTVAIKRPHPHLAADENLVRMFLDEARLAARIHHPNVVPTLDVVHGGDDLFLVMEYVHGASLSTLLAAARSRGVRIPTSVALAIVHATLEGLHAAHEASDADGAPLNLIHRDVSPQNILVGADGLTRVVDFGVAKADTRLQTTTDHSDQKGKLSYMTPERLMGQDVDRSDDLWAVAVVFWHMLTGHHLFEADSTAALVNMLLHTPIPDVSSAGAPAVFDPVFRRALSRDPSSRYRDAHDMAAAIESAAGPPATARAVAECVRGLVSRELEERAQLVREMDRVLRGRTSDAPLPARAHNVAELGVAPVTNPSDIASAPTAPGFARGVPEDGVGAVPLAVTPHPGRRARSLRPISLALALTLLASAIAIAVIRSRSFPGRAAAASVPPPTYATSEPPKPNGTPSAAALPTLAPSSIVVIASASSSLTPIQRRNALPASHGPRPTAAAPAPSQPSTDPLQLDSRR